MISPGCQSQSTQGGQEGDMLALHLSLPNDVILGSSLCHSVTQFLLEFKQRLGLKHSLLA